MTQLRISLRGWMMKAVFMAAFIFALQPSRAIESPREPEAPAPSANQAPSSEQITAAIARSRNLGRIPAPNTKVPPPAPSQAAALTRSRFSADTLAKTQNPDPATGTPHPLAPGDTTETHSMTFPFTGSYTTSINLVGIRSVANHRTILRNTGTVPIVNPWVVMNNERNFQTTQSILAEALGGQTTPENRAYAMWAFLCRFNYNWYPAESSRELHNPVRLLNIYGAGFCDDISAVGERMYKLAGLTARCWELNGHVVNEVSFSGAYRVFDSDLEFFYPTTNNLTLAAVTALQSNGSLVSRVSGSSIAALYTNKTGDYNYQNTWEDNHSMAMVLRPGEALERCHYNWGKFHDNLYQQEPPAYGNGRQIYAPPLNTPDFASGFSRVSNFSHFIRLSPNNQPGLVVTENQTDAELEFSLSTPYLYLDGELTFDVHLPNVGDVLAVRVWRSNGSQTELVSKVGPYSGPISVPLSTVTARTSSSACRDLFARISISRSAASAEQHVGLSSLTFVGEIQCAPSALPTLSPDLLNTIAIACNNSPNMRGELTVEWSQEVDGLPRYAPSTSIYPQNAAIITNSTPLLKWNSINTETDIYREVVVCHDSACLRPVAPPLIFRGEIPNEWKVPTGWLVPGRVYYWRVREGSDTAPWSPIWRFTLTPPPAGIEEWGGY